MAESDFLLIIQPRLIMGPLRNIDAPAHEPSLDPVRVARLLFSRPPAALAFGARADWELLEALRLSRSPARR